jgi:hypothetical protein
MTDEKSNTPLAQTILLIAEILSLCAKRPRLMQIARHKLIPILKEIRPKGRAQEGINEHLRQKAASLGGQPLAFPQTQDIRMWAGLIAKSHTIRFVLKEMRRKDVILDWLDENWDDVGDEFLMLLDKQGG